MFTVPVCLSPVSSLSIQMCVKILAHLAIFNGMFIELSGCLMNCKHIWRHPTNKRIYPHVVRFVHTYMNTWVFALAYVLQTRNSGAKWKHQGGQSTISHNYVNRENYCKSLLVFTAATSRAPRVFRIQYSVWLHINVLESNEIKIHFIPRFCQYCPGVCRLHCLWGRRV